MVRIFHEEDFSFLTPIAGLFQHPATMHLHASACCKLQQSADHQAHNDNNIKCTYGAHDRLINKDFC